MFTGFESSSIPFSTPLSMKAWSWRDLGRSWGGLGRSWGDLGWSWGGLWAIMGGLGRSWGALGAILGRSWGLLGRLWEVQNRSKNRSENRSEIEPDPDRPKSLWSYACSGFSEIHPKMDPKSIQIEKIENRSGATPVMVSEVSAP